jgi:GAF domain-containing protein/sugar diacid utilization regulator
MAKAAIAYLELLARAAPIIEFEAPVLDARSDGAGATVVAGLEQARGVALRVRALVDRSRRREAELSALFDTASDLALLHDLSAVLEAIVHRARALLDADVAYMTLHDGDRGDTYMRVTAGSVSAHFQHVRLPMGAGLGGLVAQTATPYLTASYADDDRFAHTSDIDGAVADEGLVAILGVPMRLGGRIVGVLFAANRSERPFGRGDVSLLTSLAAHAAVAIDNARLLEETRTAVAELSIANKAAREHSDAVERAADAHDRMAELVLRGGDVTDLAASVGDILGGALAILDVDGRPLALVGEIGIDDAVVGAAQAARGLGRTIQRGDCWATAVGPGNDSLCTLVLRPSAQLTETDLRIFERAAVVTALLLLSRRSMAEAESRVRGELLDDLVARPVEAADTVRERARRMGVDLDRPHVVLVLKGPPELRQRIASWAASQAAQHAGLAAYRDGVGLLLLPAEDPSALARRVAKDVRASVGQRVGVGAAGPVLRPTDVGDACRTAERCADAIIALGLPSDSASPADLGFVGLLMAPGDQGVDGFVDAGIGPVLEYDSQRGTALCQTLEAYFAAAASPARTADALHVHVNTVTQRLERVSTLLGNDWQRPDRALEIQLALRLHRLRAR